VSRMQFKQNEEVYSLPILSPKVLGPLSECSRSVIFENAFPGATVILVRTRNGTTQKVGKQVAINSSGAVTLFQGEEFAAGDLVSAHQFTNTEASPDNPDAIEVQKSVGKFNPPQVLTHLYKCSRGFSLGAMRPGTKVEVLDGPNLIGTGEATSGSAYIHIQSMGLPYAGKVLTARQRVCPKPPPPNGAPEWIIDTPLPPIEPLQIESDGTIPAPVISAGLTECSRAVEVSNVIPGADIVVEDAGGAWWAWKGASDETVVWVPLPVELVEGKDVEVRQEVGCEKRPEIRHHTVGPRAQLAKPQLAQIDCNTSPVVHAIFLKPEANIEFEITYQNQTTYYRSVATNVDGSADKNIQLPAPPMSVGAIVRVRQGECDNWSEWSEPVTANAVSSVQEPRIPTDLYHCQNTIPVENISPLGGILRIISSLYGEIAHIPVIGTNMSVPVAPSLQKDDKITVEHLICGLKGTLKDKIVKSLDKPSAGEIAGPLYEGDTTVTVKDVTAGAYVELWDRSGRLQTGYAPFSNGGKTTVVFSGFGTLKVGHHIYMKFWHCGQYGQSEVVSVEYRPPILNQLQPSSIIAGSGALTLLALGSNFRSGTKLYFDGWQIVSTTFVSATALKATINANDLATARTVKVWVKNSDGKESGELPFKVEALPPPPPPPPPSSIRAMFKVGFGSFGSSGRRITSVTFQVIRPNGVVETFNGTIEPNQGRSANVLYERPTYPGGTYYVAIKEVEFTWRDVNDTQDRTSTLSGPFGMGGNGTAVTWVPGFAHTVTFVIEQVNINPVNFQLKIQ
jgi:hypothetical protein